MMKTAFPYFSNGVDLFSQPTYSIYPYDRLLLISLQILMIDSF
jgi:hypothetical protein